MTDILPHTDKSMSQVIDTINAKFPELAGQGFDAYVSYVQASGIFGTFLALLFLLLGGVMSWRLFDYAKRKDDEDIAGNAFLVGAATFLVFSVLTASSGCVIKIFAPEGYVVAQIVNGVLR